MEILLHRDREDLEAIRLLQAQNLKQNLSEADWRQNGFVTCVYDTAMLEDMCGPMRHVIARADGQLAGYTLCMLRHSFQQFPILYPMFDLFNEMNIKGKPLVEYSFAVVGQICVHKDYRRQGVLQKMYQSMVHQLKGQYDYLFTEIDVENIPSLRAHEVYGFLQYKRYLDQNNQNWVVVGLEL